MHNKDQDCSSVVEYLPRMNAMLLGAVLITVP